MAHANTLRGLVKIIDNVGDDEIQDVTIPTGIPVRFDIVGLFSFIYYSCAYIPLYSCV